MYCSVLQERDDTCVPVNLTMVHSVAACCSVLYSLLQFVGVCCRALQCDEGKGL